MTTNSTPNTVDAGIVLTEDSLKALITEALQELTVEPSLANKVKGFLSQHRTALVVTASSLLVGAAFTVAVTHKDEMHNVIDALPETE